MPDVTIPARQGKPQVWPQIILTNPGGGLNNFISAEYIENTQASDLQNIQIVESGCPAKRNGHTAVGTGLSNNPKGLASYYTTSSRYVLTIDGTTLKYLNGSTWTSISGASFTSGLNATFVQAKGNLYILNGTDSVRQLTSALTLTSPTTTPSAAFGIYYNGRHIVAGVTAQPSRLYISDSTDMSHFTTDPSLNTSHLLEPDNTTDVPGATTFTGSIGVSFANIIDVSKDDGQAITGLAKFQNDLVIFKERSIYYLTFDPSSGVPSITQITAALGAVGHRSIDAIDNDVWFMSRLGYYQLGNQANYVGVIRTNETSAPIHPIIDTITPSNLANTAALRTGYLFYASIATGGTKTNNRTIVWDTRFNAWVLHTNVNANAFTEFIDSNNIKHVYYAADDQAQVYEIDSSYSDAGSPINAYWTSKAFDFGNFSLSKQILYIDFLFRQISGTVSLAVYTDGNILSKASSISSTQDATGTFDGYTGGMWGEDIFGGSNAATQMSGATGGGVTSNVPYRVTVNSQPTKTVKFTISNANNNETFVFLGAIIYFRPYGQTMFNSAQKLI